MWDLHALNHHTRYFRAVMSYGDFYAKFSLLVNDKKMQCEFRRDLRASLLIFVRRVNTDSY